MKHLFLFLLLSVIAVSSRANNVIDKIDSTAKSAYQTVDTSSTFKTMYKDVKEGILGLAEGLKVGAEHVYEVLVKQQVVYSITSIVAYIVLLITTVLFYKRFRINVIRTETEGDPWYKDDWDNHFQIISTLLLTCMWFAILATYFSFTIDRTITGLINPEYGAIREIISFVK